MMLPAVNRLRNVPKVLASLDALTKEIHSAKTYEDLKRIERAATIIKFWHSDIANIKRKAEDVIIDAHMKLGEETKKLAKAKGGRPTKTRTARGTGLPTLKERGLTRKETSQAQRLAETPKSTINAVKKELRADGKDATPHTVLKALTQGDKKQRRAVRERELGAKQRALPNKRYGVIVADPEWQFEPWSRETGMDRAADNHYPTSCTAVIAARDVPSIAAKDCVLWLYATIPMLPHALVVMAAWGFDYVSHYAWGKDKIGPGYWNREKHELLLIGTRGNIPCPAPGTQWDSLIMAPRGAHSAKPECFLEMIEQYFPTLPKIELNRRGRARPGWDAWGNEASEAAA